MGHYYHMAVETKTYEAALSHQSLRLVNGQDPRRGYRDQGLRHGLCAALLPHGSGDHYCRRRSTGQTGQDLIRNMEITIYGTDWVEHYYYHTAEETKTYC